MAMPDRVSHNNEAMPYPEPGGGPAFPIRPERQTSSAAENLGNAVGSAVEKVKQLPDRMQEMKQRFTVIRGRAQEDIAARASDLAGDLRQQAQRTVTEARIRTRRMAHQEPLKFIMATAALGFVLGIVLRIWRDHAD